MAEVAVQMVVYGLFSPLVAVPAFIFGWLVRRWWLVPLGAVALGALFTAISMVDFDAPGGSEIAWPLVPLSVLPPLAWASAGYHFGRWRRRAGAGERATAARVAAIIGGILIGTVVGGVAGFGLGEAYVTLARVSSFEGLAGYVVVFLFALPGLLIGAVAGGVVAAVINTRLAARRMTPA